MKRYHSLDIVRGLAALSVLLTHWGTWTIAYADITTKQIIVFYRNAFVFLLGGGSGTNPAVIIFIVLSGFCIHLPQALNPNKLTTPGFWRIFALRRSCPILPVFWVAILLGVINLWLVGPTNMNPSGQVINRDILFSIFGIAEIARLFGATELYPDNGPLNTVAVEILLYASYPLFCLIYKHLGLVAVIGFGLVIYCSVVLARLLGIYPISLPGTWFEFVIYWIIGAVSAGVYAHRMLKRNVDHLKLAMLVASGYLCFLLMITFVNVKGFHVVTTLMLPFLTGGLLISLLTLEPKLNQRHAKTLHFMAILGARGYSLYVVHTPVIFIMLWFLSMAIKNRLYMAAKPNCPSQDYFSQVVRI